MRVAIIDLGTNSVRFDVHTLTTGGKAKLLHREKLMIRLGQGVFLKGRMDPAAIDRTVEAMEHFKQIALGLRVRKIVAFGTSALREASDSTELVERVKKRTGIEIKVISGREEAKLIAQGVLANENPPKGSYALVDIGGGSTEISPARGLTILKGDSFPLGTARLQQVFLKRSPPREGAVRQMRQYIANVLKEKMQAGKWPHCDTLLGSSGTVRNLARLIDKKDDEFSFKDLSELVADMATMNTTQLLEIPGMEPKRVDMILSGAILLEEIARALGARKIVFTEFALRDGIIEEEKRLAKSHKSSLLELHLDDLFEHARRFGGDTEHLVHMARIASEIFARFQRIHGLEKRWEIYLLSTILLRHCGQAISYGDRAKHSFYIVKNLDFPSMDTWEHEFVARLCLHIPGGKVDGKDLNPIGKDKKRRAAFLRLLALARVIDALDLGPRTTLKIRRLTVTKGSARLSFSGKATEGIEQLMMERKKRLFEEVFGRELLLERSSRG
ncbi:MAG TPA: Ppx/GppA phosphatase family protein [Bdellovibrionota bacterium]|jgi:exopolyphosphatase/guanosine-5'-triphosphate,3'-diphosphate pyrophosphatase